ncbi:MAG: hypothetical protein WBG86_09620, partial [Polyangiales bacterium]
IVPSVSPAAPTAADLRVMNRKDLVNLYHGLDAPRFDEMHGEFPASILDQGSLGSYLFGVFGVNIKGRWLCKAFEPMGRNDGHGYNSFQTRTGVRRIWRMRTRVGPSKLDHDDNDDNDAFHLEYADFNSFRQGGPVGAQMHTMFDEVRKVQEGVYLGIGRFGFTTRTKSQLRPFLLEGPVASFVGPD